MKAYLILFWCLVFVSVVSLGADQAKTKSSSKPKAAKAATSGTAGSSLKASPPVQPSSSPAEAKNSAGSSTPATPSPSPEKKSWLKKVFGHNDKFKV